MHALPAHRPYAEHTTVSNVVSSLLSVSSQTTPAKALQSMYSQCVVSVQSEWSEAVFPHVADGMCCGAPACFPKAGLSAFPEPARLSTPGH